MGRTTVDLTGHVVQVGTLAIGPCRFDDQDGRRRWWIRSHRQEWLAIPGPDGWRGVSPQAQAEHLQLAIPTGAPAATGLAMIYTPTGHAVMAVLWSPAVEGDTPAARFPEIWMDPATARFHEDPAIAQHLRLVDDE